MQNKLLFLAVTVLAIVAQSTSTDSPSRKTTPSSKSTKDDNQLIASTTLKKKTSRIDDDDNDLPDPSSRRDRFSSFGSSPSKHDYRSRSRGPSSYADNDDYEELQEWSPYGMSSGYGSPLPPSPYETGPYLSNGPNCFPLLDSQYPFFSDLCGAVPQARYALPNAFGHIERWQIAQVLSTVLSPISPAANNPVCTRSLRLLLCPLLFPPCPTRYEPPPVLPCQMYCRAVKTQCATPGLELLPCDLLPPSSDLCPINPTPFSSFLSPFGPSPPLGGPGFPPGLPGSALSSLLAQSAMASGLPPPGFLPPVGASPFGLAGGPGMGLHPFGMGGGPAMGASPFGFPGGPPMGASPFGFPGGPAGGASPFGFPGAPAVGIPPPGFPPGAAANPGAAPPGADPAVAGASPPGAVLPSPPPSIFPPIPFPSSLNAIDATSAPFSSMFGPSALASRFAGPALPPPGLASLFSGSGMPPGAMFSPMNSLYGAPSLMGDSLSPILVDFPPLSLGQGFSPATSRFFPRLRSATEEA